MNTVWEVLKKGAGAIVGTAPVAGATTVPLTLILPTVNDEEEGTTAGGFTVSKVCSLHGHTDRIWGASWHPSGNYFVTCGGDRTARLYARRLKAPTTTTTTSQDDSTMPPSSYAFSWECIHVIEGEHQRTVRSASWTSDGRRLALSSFDATLSVWLFDPENTEEPMELESIIDGHENEVKGCAWCPPTSTIPGDTRQKSDLLATCSRDRTAWVWEANRQGGDEEGEDAEYECAGVLNGHSQDVKHVCWVPQDRSLITASYDETMKHWRELRKDDWQCVQTMTAHTGTVWCAAAQPLSYLEPSSSVTAAAESTEGEVAPSIGRKYLPDTAPLICSCSDDGTMKVWSQLERDTNGGNGSAQEVAETNGGDEDDGIDDGSYRRTKLAMVGSTGAEGFSNGRSTYSVAWCPPYAHHAPSSSSSGADSTPATAAIFSSDIVVAATADDSLCFFKLCSTDTTAAGALPTTASAAAALVSIRPIASCNSAHEGEVNCVAFAPTVMPTISTTTATSPSSKPLLQFEVLSVGDDNVANVWLLTSSPASV